MPTKIYTAQEFRAAAASPVYVGGDCSVYVRPEVYEMLEQAADMVERCDKAVESMHTQLLLADKDKRSTVSIQDLTRYFEHLERILRGESESHSIHKRGGDPDEDNAT